MSNTIVTVGMQIPGFSEHYIDYKSGKSLNDFDVIVFNPKFPWYQSEGFSGGSSALTEVASQQLVSDMNHWNTEINNALSDGKTVFVLLAENSSESIRTGSKEYKGKTTIHHTTNVNNYESLPGGVSPTNSKGTKVKVTDSRFKLLYEIVKDHLEYQVYIPGKGPGKQTFATPSGNNTLGSIYRIKDKPGHIVLLPYFNLENLVAEKDGESVWTKEGIGIGTKLVNQIVGIDKSVRKASSHTPLPDWANDLPTSEKAQQIEAKIEKIEAAIEKKKAEKEAAQEELVQANSLKALLYENGDALEDAIETALRLMDYEMSKFRKDDLEIDHIIKSPEGQRYVGEAEGKDNSAIDISKFRQLESNINEDFERDEIDEPARGILFGNGYRLNEPSKREVEFTEKCLKNAKRLNTPLIKTSDLYAIAVYLTDNNDESYKKACRAAIENNTGDIVVFPVIPSK